MNRNQKIFLVFTIASILLFFMFHMVSFTRAGSYTVINTLDHGAGSLREAVLNASADPGADYIDFAPNLDGETITLANGRLAISGTVEIDASSLAHSIRISGNDSSRVFTINPGATVTLTHLTIADGMTLPGSGACTEYCGGGIYISRGGQLALEDSIVTKNHGNSAGGIFNEGHTVISNSQIISNSAQFDAGGISSAGDMTIVNSDILNNTSGDFGGGGVRSELLSNLQIISSTIAYNKAGGTSGNGGGVLISNGQSVFIDSSTIAFNTAASTGGGIALLRGEPGLSVFQMSNSTISANRAPGYGAGLYSFSTHTSTLTSTLTNNTLTGNSSGVYFKFDSSSTVEIVFQNTIIANSNLVNCRNVTGDRSNLSDDSSCQGFRQGDARLGTLEDNGGPTLTHIPLAGSGAMGSGDTNVCQSAPVNGLDQRGEVRSAAACDIGSTEVEDIFLIYLPMIAK